MIKHYGDGDIRCLAADYGTHGAVHLPGFLGDKELARLQDVVDAAAATVDQPRTADQASSSLRSDGRLTIRYLWRDNVDLRMQSCCIPAPFTGHWVMTVVAGARGESR